jgi:hypothetical protein
MSPVAEPLIRSLSPKVLPHNQKKINIRGKKNLPLILFYYYYFFNLSPQVGEVGSAPACSTLKV